MVLLAVCTLMFGFQLGARPPWDIDEAMHAATSKVMVQTGDWIVPKFNGQDFLDKPILHNWLIALAFLVLGFTELAARLPSAVVGTGCVLLTYALGRRLFGTRTALFGAAVLATSFLQVVMSRTVVHDVSLAFAVTLALAAFHAMYRSARVGTGTALLFWAALGLAALAKGPLGVLLPAMPIGVLILWERRLGFLRLMRPGLGILVFSAIAVPWYALMALRVEGYAWRFLIEKNLLGFLSAERVHEQHLLYYVPVLALGLVPWTPFLPVALVHGVRAWRRREPGSEDLVFLAA